MKKFVSVILAAVMALSLAACSSGSASAPAASAASTEAAKESALKTVTPGKLTVATSPDFAPYEFYAIDEKGEPHLAGFDMALAQYIADDLGLELEVIPMDFDGTIAELTNKNVDMSLAGYSVTEDRKEVMDFSIVYYGGGQSFVTVKGKEDKLKDLEAANNAEFQIGAQTGSIQAGLAEKFTPNAEIVQMAKVTDIIADMLQGKMDGAFIETAVAESYQKNYPDLVIVCDVPYESEGSAAGISKGNTELVEAINAAIEKCISSGKFDEFVETAKKQAEGEIIEGLLEEKK